MEFNNEIEQNPDERTNSPLGAVMGLLSKNTSQRNVAYKVNERLTGKVRALMNKQFETFGRLARHDPEVFQEVLTYAEEHNAMLYIDSYRVGELSHIDAYTNKRGKVFKVHYTKYGGYLKKCKSDDEEPIYYKGHFPYKKYKHYFELNTTNHQYKTLEDFLIDKL